MTDEYYSNDDHHHDYYYDDDVADDPFAHNLMLQAIAPKPMAALSLISSYIVIREVSATLRIPKQPTAHLLSRPLARALLSMHIGSLFFSLPWLLSTWPIPKHDPGGDRAYQNVGTQATCTAQGAIFQIGFFAVPSFNLVSALLSLLMVRYRWTDSKIVRLECYLQVLIWVLAISLAVLPIPLESYNNAGQMCWIAPISRHCDEQIYGNKLCARGQTSIVTAYAYISYTFLCILSGGWMMTLIYQSIKNLESHTSTSVQPTTTNSDSAAKPISNNKSWTYSSKLSSLFWSRTDDDDDEEEEEEEKEEKKENQDEQPQHIRTNHHNRTSTEEEEEEKEEVEAPPTTTTLGQHQESLFDEWVRADTMTQTSVSAPVQQQELQHQLRQQQRVSLVDALAAGGGGGRQPQRLPSIVEEMSSGQQPTNTTNNNRFISTTITNDAAIFTTSQQQTQNGNNIIQHSLEESKRLLLLLENEEEANRALTTNHLYHPYSTHYNNFYANHRYIPGSPFFPSSFSSSSSSSSYGGGVGTYANYLSSSPIPPFLSLSPGSPAAFSSSSSSPSSPSSSSSFMALQQREREERCRQLLLVLQNDGTIGNDTTTITDTETIHPSSSTTTSHHHQQQQPPPPTTPTTATTFLSSFCRTLSQQQQQQPSSSRHVQRSIAVRKQSIFYMTAFILTYIPSLICYIIMLFGKPVPFVLDFIAFSIFLPLQGFLNFIVFLYLKKDSQLKTKEGRWFTNLLVCKCWYDTSSAIVLWWADHRTKKKNQPPPTLRQTSSCLSPSQ